MQSPCSHNTVTSKINIFLGICPIYSIEANLRGPETEVGCQRFCKREYTCISGVPNEFILPALPKLDLTTDAEYVANLVLCQYVIVNVQQCSSSRAYAIYLLNDIFLTDIIGNDRLKFS